MNADLKTCQTLQTQVADLREAKAALDERSSNHERIVSELEQQLRMSREKEATLVEQIQKLERETDTLRQTMSSDDQLPARLRDLAQQNAGLKHELERSKADGVQANEKTSVLVENDATLRSEVTKLKGQLCSEQQRSSSLDAEKSDIERRLNDRFVEMRTKLLKDAQKLNQEQKAEYENKIHQLKHDKSQLENELENRAKDLDASKKTVGDLEHSIRLAQGVSCDKSVTEEKVAALTDQLRVKDSKIERLRSDTDAQFASLEQKTSEEIAETKRLLEAAETAKKDSAASLDRYRTKAEMALKEQQNKATREKDDLHQQLAHVESVAKESERTMQKVRADTEDALRKQQEKSRTDLGEYQRRLSEMEAAKTEVEATIDRIQKETERKWVQQEKAHELKCEALRERALKAEASIQEYESTFQALSSRTSSQRPSNPASKEALPSPVPADQIKKPRRKVDRTSNSILEVSWSSHGFGLSNSAQKGPIRAESFEDQIFVREDTGSSQNDLGRFEKLDENGVSLVQVPETQCEEVQTDNKGPPKKIETFKQFNRRVESVDHDLVNGSSSPLSDPETVATPPLVRRVVVAGRQGGSRVLRELNVDATTPVRVVPPPGLAKGACDTSSSFGTSKPVINPFFDPERPFSRTHPNTASRMAPTTQHGNAPSSTHPSARQSNHHVERDSRPYGNGSLYPQSESTMTNEAETHLPPLSQNGQSSSPDYVDSAVSQKITTYHRPNSRSTSLDEQPMATCSDQAPASASSLKRRASINRGEELERSKRSKGTSSQASSQRNRADSRTSNRPLSGTRTVVEETQSQTYPQSQNSSQASAFKSSQSQRQPLNSIPPVRSQMRSSQAVRETGGARSSRTNRRVVSGKCSSTVTRSIH